MNQAAYIQRHYERLFAMNGIAAAYRLPHPTLPAPAVLELEVLVVPANTPVSREDDQVTVEQRVHDWLINADQLTHDLLEGVTLITPDETHRIVIPPCPDVPWASPRFYRPLPPMPDQPLWRWSDPHQRVLRIHTAAAAADSLQPPYEIPPIPEDNGGGGS